MTPPPLASRFRTVTVPLDLSPAGDRAIGPATRLATALGATVELLTMVAPGMPSVVERSGLDKRAGGVTGVSVSTRIIESLNFPSTLADWGARGERLLCLNTRGRGALGKAVLGSVAAGVAHAAMAPFVLIGPDADSDASGAFETIVACVDGTEPTDLIADSIADIQRALRSETTVVTVNRPGPIALFPGPEDFAPVQRIGAALLERGCFADRRLLEEADVAGAIVRFSALRTKPLLITGTSQPATLVRVARPSVALEIVRIATAPVLLVPFGRAAERRRRAMRPSSVAGRE